MFLTRLSGKMLRPLFGQGVLIALPLLILANLVLWLGYEMTAESAKERWRAQSELSADSTLLALEQRRNDLRADLNLLAANPLLGTAVRQQDDLLLKRIAADWELFVAEKQLYDHIRLIDSSGMEWLRVDLTPQGASSVPGSFLQDKSQRYYFQRAMALDAGRIYASPIDLNMENGALEIPYKPMLRLVTPLEDGNGEKTALLVLNALASHIFDDLVRQARLAEGQLLFLDESGYYLRGFSASQEWGFMFPGANAPNQRFDETYPDIWSEIRQRESGQIDHAKGLFSFRTVKYGSSGYEQRYRLVVTMLQQQQSALLEPQRALWWGVSLTLSVLLLIVSLIMARHRLRLRAAESFPQEEKPWLWHFFR